MPKVVLITGASSGFGRSTAEHLSENGLCVWGTSRKAGAPAAVAGYTMVGMDVRDAVSVNNAVATVVEREGRIDVLVNNAGISLVSPLEETPLETVHAVLDVNLYGVLRVCQAAAPVMRQNGGGTIINISSIGGLMGLPFRGVYSASKFALEGLTESLSMELQAFGISVCMIEPGDFKTSIDQNRLEVVLGEDSPYGGMSAAVEEIANLQVKKAAGPALMGPTIYKIIHSRKRRLRYKIGSPTEKLSVLLKKVLPGRMFEKIILGYYKS